jgi:hypothetical protein
MSTTAAVAETPRHPRHDLDRDRADRLGISGRRLLIVTVLLYLLGTGAAAALTTGRHTGWLVCFYATRLVAGMGIGGQDAEPACSSATWSAPGS